MFFTAKNIENKKGYYYGLLSSAQRKVYDKLLDGITSFTSEIVTPYRHEDEMNLVLNYLMWDNPMIFYVKSFNISYNSFRQKCRVFPAYTYNYQDVKFYKNEVLQHLKVYDAARTLTEFEKELYVHDYCLRMLRYDCSLGESAHSILGPVLKRAAVCEGIAKFVKLSLDYLGVNNLVVFGKAVNPINGSWETHAWNIVEILRQTYHLDVTFDLTMTANVNRYDYFNLPECEITKDHIFENIIPKCAIADNDYYSLRGAIANSPVELDRYLEKCLKSGKRNIHIKLRNVKDKTTVIDKVMSMAQQHCASAYNPSTTVEISCNQTQGIFEIEYK